MAEILVATPLRVPRIRKEDAELVRRIVEQGKAKMTAQDLTSMRANMPISLVTVVGKRAEKGVRT
jgi:hypothetical protein